jgi:outer membrane protein assembly factor BamB
MRKNVFLCAVAAASAGFFSCASKPAPGPVLAPGPIFPLGEESRIDFDGELLGPLLAFGSDVVLSTASGRIVLVSPAEKKILWQFAAKAPLAVPALAGSEFIIVFDQGGRITRLSRDGKAAWEKAFTGAVSNPPALASGSILAVFDRRTLRCFDPATGIEKWSWTADADLLAGPRSWGGTTVLLTAGKKAVLLSADGKPGLGFETSAAASGPLLISGDRMYAGFENGTFQSWDLRSRKRRWTVKTGAAPAADPVADGARIYLVTEGRQLFAIDKKNGAVRWWQSLSGRAVGEAALCGGRLLAPSLSPVLTAFDPPTGKKAETNDLKQNVIAAPLVLGGRVEVAVRDPVTLKETLVILKGKPLPPPPAPKKNPIPGE